MVRELLRNHVGITYESRRLGGVKYEWVTDPWVDDKESEEILVDASLCSVRTGLLAY